MLSRTEILKEFGLPDCAAYEIAPERDPTQSIWRIKVGCEGYGPTLMSPGSAAKLSDVIRKIDPRLADQLKNCLLEAKNLSQDSN